MSSAIASFPFTSHPHSDTVTDITLSLMTCAGGQLESRIVQSSSFQKCLFYKQIE